VKFVCEEFYQNIWIQKLREVCEFICYSLHAIQELLTDKEDVLDETQQYNTGDTRVYRRCEE
jgi:hypothetical protein